MENGQAEDGTEGLPGFQKISLSKDGVESKGTGNGIYLTQSSSVSLPTDFLQGKESSFSI